MKIAVAMSGGVDSSTVAYLLKQSGHEVFGITMMQFDDEAYGFPQDAGLKLAIRDAKLICDKLGIEHHIVDIRDYFEETVVKNFLEEYENGRTPNPCTFCNPLIKWGKLLDSALKLGADKMATGHYVKLLEKDDGIHILRPNDSKKDQTYMLWRLQQHQLKRTLFPLASYKKSETREILKGLDLEISEKKDSQEICFIYGLYKDFIKDKISYSPGNIVLENGEIIGRHIGLPFYTIGQRKGLVPWKCPLYVKKIDTKKNVLIVTENKSSLVQDYFDIKDVNWINSKPVETDQLLVKVRYKSNAVKVKELKEFPQKIRVYLSDGADSITPGQSAVFYKGDELIGGGIIN